MNHYTVLELTDADGKPSGLYHYVVVNKRIATHPIGYCAQGCPGHPTREEAYEHQRQYELDQARYDGQLSGQMLQCRVCGAWTQRYASIRGDYGTYVLCDAHCNREELAKLHHIGDAWGS